MSAWGSRDDGRRAGTLARRTLTGLAALLVALSPPAAAAPVQEDPSGAPPGSAPTIDIDVDVSTGDADDVARTIDDLAANVEDQLGTYRTAQQTLADAEVALEDARATVETTESRIQDLVDRSDEVVVDAFVNPPGGNTLDALATGSPSDVAMKQTILDMEADGDAAVLEDLEEARADLEDQKEDEEQLAVEAEDARAAAAAEVADLESAVSQQTSFFASVEDRLEHRAGEAAALERLDPAMAEDLRADQDELANRMTEIIEEREAEEALQRLVEAQQRAEEEAARQAAQEAAAQEEAEEAAAEEAASQPPQDLGAPSGSLATVNCPAGGSITVDSSLSSNLSSLLDAAAADGVQMCGGGYRDPQRQIELRQQNCGTSSYAIYEMPSSSCSPPTARPGTSNHEQGLAIDFTCNGGGVIGSQSSPCFVWMSNNAASYGLYNLPSEPWHWSTDGT